MILGIDTGGTNVDAALVDEDGVYEKTKVPTAGTEIGIESVLAELDGAVDVDLAAAVDRVVVVTTLVVNAAVQDRLPPSTNLLIPGPGLDPERCFTDEVNEVLPGCVDHRGRITEETDSPESVDTPVVAITSKFASRNPDLEATVRTALDHDDTHLAVGNEAGAALTFPERAATTVANAKAKPVFDSYRRSVADVLETVGIDAPIYYLKGDGAMLTEQVMRQAPAHTLRSGVAASALGLLALTGREDAICVDVGGTTTDLARVVNGFLDVDDRPTQGDIDPAYDGAVSLSFPLGGDTRVDAGPCGPRYTEQRDGNAAAFGGSGPTLTDALHVLGEFTAGDVDAARAAVARLADGDVEACAEAIVDRYVDRIAAGIDNLAISGVATVIVGGVLAPYLARRLTRATRWMNDWETPTHGDVAGAVGCAVARVSVETAIHIDSARGVQTVTSVAAETVEDVAEGRIYTDDEIREIALRRASEAAEKAGGDPDHPCEVRSVNRFDVVRHARVAGQIIDARARVEPGIENGFGGAE